MFEPNFSRNPRVVIFTLYILLACTLGSSVTAGRAATPDKKKDRWNRIQQLAITAFKLRDEEMKLTGAARQAKFEERAHAFLVVARDLYGWVIEYYPDDASRRSGDYVYAAFTLALYIEYSGNFWEARLWYQDVLQRHHELVVVRKMPEPTYRGVKIASLAEDKWRKISAFIARHPKSGIYDFRITQSDDEREQILAYLHKHEAQLADTLYKSDTEEAEIVRLRAETKADAVAAPSTERWLTRYGLEILRASSLPARVHSSPGLVIFGVGGNNQSLHRFATRLQPVFHLLGSSSTQGSQSGPHGVFVNFGGDEVAQKMALALSSENYNGESGECISKHSIAVTYRKNTLTSLSEVFRSPEGLVASCIMRRQMGLPPGCSLGIPLLFEEFIGKSPVDNERLYYLLEALEANKMPSVKRLLSPVEEDYAPERKLVTYAALRYFAMFLYLRQPQRNQLRKIYGMLRDDSLGENSRSCEEVIKSVTGLSEQSLQDEFIAFIRRRPVAIVDKRWKELRRSAHDYVKNDRR